jgi:transposase
MLRPGSIGPIPAETARIARAAFPKGSVYLRVADELGALFTDDLFHTVYPTHGQPALAPWRLALVTILQYAEGLSDRQAADAVRSRIDWKYVLRLELTDPGFDASVLSEFRTRLLEGDIGQLVLDTLLMWCREHQLLGARGRQRTDSTHVLAAVRALNRIEVVGETMRHALNTLAAVAPEWLRAQAIPEWAERYARRAEDDRLPSGKAAREALALTIGADGHTLLAAIDAAGAPAWLREVPALATLRQVWLQQYQLIDGTVQWRAAADIPPASIFISSPYDRDAHYAKKRSTQWVGYKVHVTETCDEDAPNLITHVETTPAPVADGEVTARIHGALAPRDLLPKDHIVDTGYLDAALLVSSRAEYQVELVGPTRSDYHWQAREDTGFAVEHFQLDWERQQATCPEGHTSISWTPAKDKRTNDVIKMKFSTRDCGPCPSRSRCTRSQKKSPRRTITVRTHAEYHALGEARRREKSEEFTAVYATRAGIEGTLSRGIRRCRMRRIRYVGLRKAHLAHVLTAVALNVVRLGEWLAGQPRAQTRRSAFAMLMADGQTT